jgi:hypothetical protein
MRTKQFFRRRLSLISKMKSPGRRRRMAEASPEASIDVAYHHRQAAYPRNTIHAALRPIARANPNRGRNHLNADMRKDTQRSADWFRKGR